jgi:hypothetical protein
MEISSIGGIRALSIIKAPPANPDLTPIFDIENSSRTGDETYSSSNRNSSGGQDSDDLEDRLTEDEPEPNSPADLANPTPLLQVNFFA